MFKTKVFHDLMHIISRAYCEPYTSHIRTYDTPHVQCALQRSAKKTKKYIAGTHRHATAASRLIGRIILNAAMHIVSSVHLSVCLLFSEFATRRQSKWRDHLASRRESSNFNHPSFIHIKQHKYSAYLQVVKLHHAGAHHISGIQ